MDAAALITNRITPQIARNAIHHALPTIRSMMNDGTAKRHDLCIFIVDPEFGETLASEILGNTKAYEYPYEDFAKKKAAFSVRTRSNGGWAMVHQPSLIEDEDKVNGEFYPGGVFIDQDGIQLVVGTSGVQAELDEGISRLIGYLAIALAKLDHHTSPWGEANEAG